MSAAVMERVTARANTNAATERAMARANTNAVMERVTEKASMSAAVMEKDMARGTAATGRVI